MAYYADVIVPINIKQLLTYALPEDLVEHCEVGTRVAVPIGKKNLYTAVVVKIHEQQPLHYEAKPIKEVLDAFPILNIFQLKLFKWVNSYYLSSYNEILKACLPSALLIQSETLIQLENEKNVIEEDLTDDEYLVIEAIQKQQQISLKDIQKILNKSSAMKVVNRLLDKNLIVFDRQVKEKYKPKVKTYLSLNEKYHQEDEFKILIENLDRAHKQKAVVFEYFKLKAQAKKPISRAQLTKAASVSDGVIKSLIDKDVLIEYTVKQDRVEGKAKSDTTQIVLSEDQNQAYQAIINNFKQKDTVLFKGITSSGKTEIYLQLIKEYLHGTNQILYLLPEIALTTQLISRIQEKFGKQVLVYHSKYSANERVEIYKKVLHNHSAQVIVGTRSAIFLPFSNLQFIIVDEAHENSFKQHDPSPRYHARDTAIVLSKIHKTKILLGTATPSFESYYNVKQGKFGFVELNKRYGNVTPPKVSVIDLSDSYKRKKMQGHFSLDLIEKIQHTLDKGKQVIIFQNRRGYSPILECTTCGHVPQCPSCDVSLTIHKVNNTMRCHYCGYKMAIQKRCLSCSGVDLRLSGFGTEQIEQEAKSLFPKANIKRMDLDTTRGKYDFEKLIASFENLETDILIGTQMLTKGLDFRNVDLVAVMHADGLLFFPNFRAFEKSYQLLVQVSGRAGRTKEQGEVVIQTFNPKHPVINHVVSKDYEGFYKIEMEQRREFKYPPYYKMIKLVFKSRDYNRLNEAADWLSTYLKQVFKSNILGPEFPNVSRIRNQYIKHILIKIPPKQSLTKTKAYLEEGIKRYENVGTFKSVRLNVDVDPFN
jgi:primosomal protein N' (replication factor Y)